MNISTPYLSFSYMLMLKVFNYSILCTFVIHIKLYTLHNYLNSNYEFTLPQYEVFLPILPLHSLYP